MSTNFDRLRQRAAANGSTAAGPAPGARPDAEGKRALFSGVSEAIERGTGEERARTISADPVPTVPALGALSLTCSGCAATSALTVKQALTAALPSLHLPILRRRYPSWMRCPACRRHTWVRLDLRR